MNLVTCERFGTKMPPKTCKEYRTKHPDGCRGCEQTDEMDRLAAATEPAMSSAPEAKPKPKNMVGACVKCGEEKTIIGRGLCGSCYRRAKADGNLDQFMAKTKPHHAQPENQKTGEPEAASAETEPASVETTKPSGGPRLKVLNLRFDLEDQRDSELLSRLQNAAKMDRREIEQEVMALLDTVVCA